MKTTSLHLIATAALLLFAITVTADEAKEEKVVKLINQTHCPVMGGTIDSTVFTDIQGQRVYHCCPMCSKSLKENPNKYFKEAAAKGIVFENIQTTCPVSGKELNEKKIFSDFEGRRIYFCCEGCPGKFAKTPHKFLKSIDAPAESGEEDKAATKETHEGHDH